METLRTTFFQVLDLLLCLLQLPKLAWLALTARRVPLQTHSLSTLRVLEGGSLEGMYAKYGNLDVYLNHLIPGVTKQVIGVLFETPNAFKIKLREDYCLCETPFNPKLPLASAMHFIATLLRLTRLHDINIFHSNTPFSQGFATWIATRLAKRPFVFSLHSDYLKREALKMGSTPRTLGSHKLSMKVFSFLAKRADRVFPIRESMRPQILAHGAHDHRIRVFPHGMDLDELQKRANVDMHHPLGIPQTAMIISSACRLVKDNYTQDLLRLADHITQRWPDAYVVIAGDGSERAAMQRQVEQMQHSDRVLMPGFLSHDQVLSLRRVSQVNLCLMGGFALLEACASGRPTIAYAVEWHHELVIDGDTGYLVAEADIDTVLERIDTLIQEPQQATMMGVRAKQHTYNHHHLPIINPKKAALYFDVLKTFAQP